MKKIRSVALALALVVVAGLTVACSTVNTDPSQVALHYSGGSWESQSYEDCVPAGTQQNFNSAGDHYYYYPTGQRTYRFSDEPGSDSGPIKVTAKDRIELTVRGSLTFDFAASCDKEYTDAAGKKWKGGILQKFHEELGTKDKAAAEDDGEPMGDGWGRILRTYIGEIVDRTADNEALRFDTAELSANEVKKAEWEKAVLEALPKRIKERTNGEDYFTVKSTVLQKPDIPDSLKQVIAEGVAVDQRGANAAKERLIGENWPGGLAGYQQYLNQQAINEAIKSGKASIVVGLDAVAVK